MDQSKSYIAPSNFPGYESYIINAGSNSHRLQHMYNGRPPYPGSYPRPKEVQEESLDLSGYHALAQRSVNEVPLQDVIKPQESGPWTSAQTTGQHSGQPYVTDWPVNSVYAKSEPPAKLDECYGYTDSAYGTSITSHWDNRFVPSLMDNDNDGRSVFSDGYLRTNQRHGKRKPQVPRCHCGKTPKNPSDAKKHALTHVKPFRCVEYDCQRKEGFATENDLQRHRKSVHNLIPSVGSRAGYICAACPAPEVSPRKFWPRRDNFKAHIKRKHPDKDIEQLLEMSMKTKRPDDAVSVKTFAESNAPGSQIDTHDINHYQMDVSPSLSRHPSEQGNYQDSPWPSTSAANMHTDPLSGGLLGHLQFQDPSIQHAVGGDDGLSVLGHAPNEAAYTDGVMSTSPYKRRKMEEFQPDLAGSGPSSAQSASTALSQGEYECPYCRKKKRRECDLKKHMKRHTRPYGCTFPSCQKKFGSRNDWKRHECSQHFLQEMWKCEETCKDGTKCMRRPFHHRESLERHLRGVDHGMQDTNEIDRACRKFRLGREGHDHFWCGFCKQLVEPAKGVQAALDERFKHIGDHFDKDGLDSGEWVCIEENKKKKYISPSDAKDGKRKMREEGSGDEFDLEDYPELALQGAMFSPASPSKCKYERLEATHDLFE